MAENDLDEAEQALVRASYLNRDDAESMQYRIALAERRGQPQEAAKLRSRMARMTTSGVRA